MTVALDPAFTNVVPGWWQRNVGAQLAVSVSGLSPATVYYSRVRSFDAVQNVGGYSPVASATTLSLSLSQYCPTWTNTPPATVVNLDYNGALSPAANGTALLQATQALQPGQRLLVGGGNYQLSSPLALNKTALPLSPIWIAAKAGQTPILAGANASVSVVEFSGGASHLVLSGLRSPAPRRPAH